MEKLRWLVAGAVAAVLLAGSILPRSAYAGAEDWNDANIKWQSYEDGLKAAKKEKKPMLLVFYTSWCPHCANYAKVFRDPALVEKSKKFVMVRVDGDKNKALSDQFKPDGSYIPRTFFLSPDGSLDPSITAGRPQYKYFYDETKADGVLGGMDAALAKFTK